MKMQKQLLKLFAILSLASFALMAVYLFQNEIFEDGKTEFAGKRFWNKLTLGNMGFPQAFCSKTVLS
jgi:hypothetical protein